MTMKSYLMTLMTFLSLTALVGCTSEDSKLKERSLAEGTKILETMLKMEADEALPAQYSWLRQAYVDFGIQQSELKVAAFTRPSESTAWVVVEVLAYSKETRKALLGAATKVEPSKQRNFNFGEALTWAHRGVGLSKEKVAQPIKSFRYTKAGKDWNLDP